MPLLQLLHNPTARRAQLLRLLSNTSASSNAINTSPTPSEDQQEKFDSRGAVLYTVTIVSVFALGIIFMIASHVKRSSSKRELDRAICEYLRRASEIRLRGDVAPFGGAATAGNSSSILTWK
ncbi:hypothetical protein BOX15_Mlig013848g1 [Macrostomum lignano]|uniref:Uncharacterized protein n=1 Tax=Macrostomum lignano TaxID=282301 RepID=A0A267E0N5_9PLAT|nr:hypothetical protein BOX15_Mlig013848g1 [Macrostomum lignano]